MSTFWNFSFSNMICSYWLYLIFLVKEFKTKNTVLMTVVWIERIHKGTSFLLDLMFDNKFTHYTFQRIFTITKNPQIPCMRLWLIYSTIGGDQLPLSSWWDMGEDLWPVQPKEFNDWMIVQLFSLWISEWPIWTYWKILNRLFSCLL